MPKEESYRTDKAAKAALNFTPRLRLGQESRGHT
jgi:hypothetical protein